MTNEREVDHKFQLKSQMFGFAVSFDRKKDPVGLAAQQT